MSAVLVEFIEILIGGLVQFATGIGTGVNQFVSDLFFVVGVDGVITGLSTFGGITAIFGGIGLATGLTALIFYWIRSLGH